MTNQDNKGIQKDNNKSPENKFKDIEECDLNDRIQDSSSKKKKLNKM